MTYRMKIFIILSVVLLIKKSLGETQKTSNELSPNEEAFRDAVIAKLSTLSEEPIELAKQFFEDAYADKTNSENTTIVLAEILNKFKENHLEIPKNIIKAFLFLSLLFDVLSSRTNISSESDERTIGDILPLKDAFEKYDTKSVSNEFRRKFDEFLEWLTLEFEEKRNKLTSVEKLRVKAFKELWTQLREETNFGKREGFLQMIASRVA